MALEAVIFSQDPLSSYNRCKEYTTTNLCNFGVGNGGSSWSFDYANYSSKLEDKTAFAGIFDSNNNYDFSNSNASPSKIIQNSNVINPWDHQQYVNSSYSSPEGHCTLGQYLPCESPPVTEATPTAAEVINGGGRRKRRRRSCKNKEEVEHQRMTHIAVERNRRKQMNDYLAVIRSLMPASYAQRGDQASIVGGAINYVKELEQLLQTLEAQKRTKQKQQQQQQQREESESAEGSGAGEESPISSEMGGSPIFGEFFSFPQYSNRGGGSTKQRQPGSNNSVSGGKSVAEIEVNMVDSHANVKILAKKQPKQLLKLVAGFQGLRFCLLHLNVTAVDSLVLYSFSLKVEEGSRLNSVDDIAAAANQILRQIQEEAATSL